jgi:hypothetical protein
VFSHLIFPLKRGGGVKLIALSVMIVCMRTLAILFFVILGLSATPALAQTDANSFIGTQLQIELQPKFPQPGEDVTATLNDYSGGVYGSSIAWMIDGVEVPGATNQRSITFVAGKNGSTQVLEIILSVPLEDVVVIKKDIKPIYLDIIIEPQTRVPDFYLGRSLPSIGSQVNTVALLGDGDGDTSQYTYTWIVDRKVIEGGPLRGGSRVSFTMSMGKSVVLSLSVSDMSGKTIAGRSLLIPSVKPEVHFYEVSTLFGMSYKPFNTSVPIIGNTVTVQAEPYYLDSQVFNSPDITTWKVDSITSNSNTGNPYQVTLQRVGETGESNLGFHVRSTKQLLQGVEANININF